jgi:hypothetical protein
MRNKSGEPLARGFNTQTGLQINSHRGLYLGSFTTLKPMLRQGNIVGKRQRIEPYSTSR